MDDFTERAKQTQELIGALTTRLQSLEASLGSSGAAVRWPQFGHKKWQQSSLNRVVRKKLAGDTAEDAPAAAAAQDEKKVEEPKEKDAGKEKKKKKKKKVKFAKSDVVLDIMPDTSIDDFSWDLISKTIREDDIHGLIWAKDFPLRDFVFGQKKMTAVCQIIDSIVQSTEPLIEGIKTIPGVADVQLVTIETASQDWDPTNESLRKGGRKLGGASAGSSSQQNDGSQKKKKNKKKKKKKDEKKEITPEDITKAANRLAVSTKDVEYYVGHVNELDGSGQNDVTREHLAAVAAQVRAKTPDIVLMLSAAGSSKVSVLASVSEAKKGKCSAKAWVESTLIEKADGDDMEAFGEYLADAAKDEFAIKLKDQCNTMAFAYLRKERLVVDDDSDDDDVVFLDDLSD